MTHWIKTQDGQEYAIRFTQVVYIQLSSMEDIPSNQIQKFLSGFASWPLSRVYRFYWLAFKNGSRKENKDFDMTEEDFMYWVNDDETIFPQILKAMELSSPTEQKKTAPRAATTGKR